MENRKRTISLGITNQEFEPGVHICQIFNDDDERHNALIEFIVSGLQAGEHAACYSENESEASLTSVFQDRGLSLADAIKSGDFSLNKTRDAYFQEKKFDPDRMLNTLKSFYINSVDKKKSGARVIGEMTADIEHIDGGSKLMEYESKVSMLVKEYPVNAVCQYDARVFDGSTILDVLKVHPYIVVKGAVVHNPFYIKPEDYLSHSSAPSQ